jgi:signal transduction histidine kinase
MNRFDRVLLIRHFAICVGAVTAYVLRQELALGYTALWIVGISSWLNFGAYFFRTRPSLTRLCLIASPIIGIGSWGALSAATNGVASPFVAGLWLEVVLSAMALAPTGIILVTLGSVCTLWGLQWWVGFGGVSVQMVLNTGFLLGMGGATFLVNRRWTHTHEMLTKSHELLGDRMETLEQQLEDGRALSSLGQNAARLAHGHKNAVHSLRGFVALIEPKLKGNEALLEGLRMAIDDLEQLAFLTLNQDDAVRPNAEIAASCRPVAAIGRVLEEIAIAHPKVNWKAISDGTNPDLNVSAPDFVEALRALVTNAAESMNGAGEASVETMSIDGVFKIVVSDSGCGMRWAETERIFERAYTTKPTGSGYGLFLVKRFVEDHGGKITARPGDPVGAVLEVTLPLGTGFSASAPDLDKRVHE